MKVVKYYFLACHDKGQTVISTHATSMPTARKMVADAENAPLSAIKFIPRRTYYINVVTAEGKETVAEFTQQQGGFSSALYALELYSDRSIYKKAYVSRNPCSNWKVK